MYNMQKLKAAIKDVAYLLPVKLAQMIRCTFAVEKVVSSSSVSTNREN